MTPAELAAHTIAHYERRALPYREGTADHDVSQNINALLGAISGTPPFRLLDFGCGPGRDLQHFSALGHRAIGLDGAAAFVEMARAGSGCEVWHQDFLALELPLASFDGIFANATLFHIPRPALPEVLRALRAALVPAGVLFSSNPRGDDRDAFDGTRYGAYYSWPTWRALLLDAGFEALDHYYRPSDAPPAEQHWLASLWRKPA